MLLGPGSLFAVHIFNGTRWNEAIVTLWNNYRCGYQIVLSLLYGHISVYDVFNTYHRIYSAILSH
jgi:hypothetical protein